MDMSPAFISGYFEYFSHADLVFDRFHIVSMLNEARDKTRRDEQQDKKQAEPETLLLTYPVLGEAYKYKEDHQLYMSWGEQRHS